MSFAIFILSGFMLVLSGIVLARQADAIASISKLGRFWVGSILLAGATSLPELFTDISAVFFHAPDLAAGDLFGSSMANMLILSIIDLIPSRGRVFKNAAFDHALSANLAICLSAFAAIFILIRPSLSIGGLSLGSIILFVVYLAGNRAIFGYTKSQNNPNAQISKHYPKGSLKFIIFKFSIAALVTAVTAPILAWSAEEIASITGLGNTFIGTWLIGISTSLPELASSIAAVRLGAFDLAVGNLFGSNAINMALFLPLDLVHDGDFFADINADHALSAIFSVILMSIGLAAIVHRAKFKIPVIEPDSLLMLIIYVLAMLSLYFHIMG